MSGSEDVLCWEGHRLPCSWLWQGVGPAGVGCSGALPLPKASCEGVRTDAQKAASCKTRSVAHSGAGRAPPAPTPHRRVSLLLHPGLAWAQGAAAAAKGDCMNQGSLGDVWLSGNRCPHKWSGKKM